MTVCAIDDCGMPVTARGLCNSHYARAKRAGLPPLTSQTPAIPDPPGPWILNAGCEGFPPNWWFPERGEDSSRAVGICTECPVRVDCLEYALGQGIKHGIWGGMSERARRLLRRERRKALATR